MKTNALPFHKLHGLGNDFVLFDLVSSRNAPALIRSLQKEAPLISDRKSGVGFDQMLVLLKAKNPRVAELDLLILNADGSRAEMCGNGLRAAALYWWRKNPKLAQKPLRFKTDAGVRSTILTSSRLQNTNVSIECEMGFVQFKPLPKTLTNKLGKLKMGSALLEAQVVDVGNPHLVIFIDAKNKNLFTPIVLAEWGSFFERNRKAFPRRTNVEFAFVKSKKEIHALVWERGVGLTQACGTGAVAVACAAISLRKAQHKVAVLFPGGKSTVEWSGKSTHFTKLISTATSVFTGVWTLSKN